MVAISIEGTLVRSASYESLLKGRFMNRHVQNQYSSTA